MDNSHYIPEVVATATTETPVDEESVAQVLDNCARLKVVPWQGWGQPDSEQLARSMMSAYGLLIRTGVVDADLMDKCSNLRVIALHGSGTDQVDLAAAQRRNITVTNVPGGNAVSVAEMTIGLALSLLRGIPQAHLKLTRTGDWDAARRTGRQLRDTTWGVVGMGYTGRTTARLASALGCCIIYHDPYLRPETQQELTGWERIGSLEDLLSESDLVSVHVPLNSDTYHLINENSVSAMSAGSYLINVSRGAVCDQLAVARASHEGNIAGVALDVFDPEPLSPEQVEKLTGPGVILTPHLAGSTTECLEAIARQAAADIRNVLKGKEPKNPVAINDTS